MNTQGRRAAPLVGIGLLVAAAAALAAWWFTRGGEVLPIAGEPAAVARAQAGDEGVAPAALDVLREEAARRDVHALVLHRRGHRLFEYFAHDEAEEFVPGGKLAAAVLQLTLVEPGQRDSAAAAEVARLVSERLWLPLRADEARLEDDGARPWHCCIRAHVGDWMRVADLVMAQGAYLGERIISADAIRELLQGQVTDWQGDEPLLARDGLAFDLAPGLRIWIAPRRQLTLLVWGDVATARDTLLPNIVLRGLEDAAPAIGGELSDIVPGH